MKPECEMLRGFLTDPAYKSERYTSIESICEALSARLSFEVIPKAIRNCINYWDKKFNKLYFTMKKHGMLSGNPEDDWNIVMISFGRNYGIEPLFFQKTNGLKGIRGTYINASFKEIEDIKTVNLVHKLRGVATQLKSMELIGATFQLTGKTPEELLKDAKKMEIKVLNGEVKEDKY